MPSGSPGSAARRCGTCWSATRRGGARPGPTPHPAGESRSRRETTRHAGADRGAALGPQASRTDLDMRNITLLNPGDTPLQRALLVINLILKTGRATSQLGRRRQRSPGRVSHGRRHPSGRYLPAPDRRTAQPDGRLSQTTGPISGWSNRLVRRQTGRHPVNRPAPRPHRPRTRESQHHEGPAVGEGQPPSPLAQGPGRPHP